MEKEMLTLIKQIAKRLDGIDKKIDRNATKIDRNGKKIDNLKTKVEANGKRIDRNAEMLMTLHRKVDANSDDINALIVKTNENDKKFEFSEKVVEYMNHGMNFRDGIGGDVRTLIIQQDMQTSILEELRPEELRHFDKRLKKIEDIVLPKKS